MSPLNKMNIHEYNNRGEGIKGSSGFQVNDLPIGKCKGVTALEITHFPCIQVNAESWRNRQGIELSLGESDIMSSIISRRKYFSPGYLIVSRRT